MAATLSPRHLATALLILVIPYAVPASGQGTFQRNDNLYSDHSIEFQALDPTHFNSVRWEVRHPGGGRAITFTMPAYPTWSGSYPALWYLDINGDGNFEVDQRPMEDHATTYTWTYPQPTHWAERYNTTLGFVFWDAGHNNYVWKSSSFPIYITPTQRIYADSYGNAIVQLRDEACADKIPVVIVEGWDPANTTYPWEYAYNFQSMLDSLYNNNCEVFVLNFADAGASMLANADVVVGALQRVHELCPSYETVAIGFSMGGVVTKYALAKAERQQLDHHVGVFVSYDAPLCGANANLSMQTQIARTSAPDNWEVAEVQAQLQRPATKELLIANYYDSRDSAYMAFHAVADTANGDGYPKRCYNVAVSNGMLRTTWPQGRVLAGQKWLADASVIAEGYQVPVIHILANEFDVGAASLRHMDFDYSIHKQISFIIFSFDVGLRVTTDFDPGFIPTWSALGMKYEETLMDPYGNITGFQHPIAFDDTIVQETDALYHQDVSSEVKERLVGWLSATSMLTVRVHCPQGGSDEDVNYEVGKLHKTSVAVAPRMRSVGGSVVTYIFDHWGDGNTQNPRFFTEPRAETLTVVMKALPPMKWSRDWIVDQRGSGPAVVVEPGVAEDVLFARSSSWAMVFGEKSPGACAWKFVRVDSAYDFHFGTSQAFAVGPQRVLAAAYLHQTGETIWKLRFCRGSYPWPGAPSRNWSYPVDLTPALPGPVSIKVDASGTSHIGFLGQDVYGNPGVMYARVSASGVLQVREAVATSCLPWAGSDAISLALDSQGRPAIAFSLSENVPFPHNSSGLGFARRLNGAWTPACSNSQIVEPTGGWACSLVLDALDQARVSHRCTWDNTIHLTSWSNATSQWTDVTVPASQLPGLASGDATALALDATSGAPRIAAWVSGNVPVLLWKNAADPNWSASMIDVSGPNASALSIGLDSDGSPVVGYSNTGVVAVARGDFNGQEDATPPGQVGDVRVTTGKTTAVIFWTATGDDGTVGTASNYDVRYSATSPITSEAQFAQALPLAGVACPSPAGSGECATVTGIGPCSPIYCALKVRDGAGNWSGLSNAASGTTHCTGSEVGCDEGGGGFAARQVQSGDGDGERDVPLGLSITSANPGGTPPRILLAIPRALAGQNCDLAIFDVGGRRIRTIVAGAARAGENDLAWDLRRTDGSAVSSGVYYVRLRIDAQTITRSVILFR